MPFEDRLRVIILAAGAARRLGRDKATLAWGRITLLEHVISQFPQQRVGECVVVANSRNRGAIGQIVPDGVEIAVNPDANSDMIASVLVGLEALRSGSGPLCIHPVDVFAVCPELIAFLHEAWQADRERMHLPEVGGKGAHPLIVAPRLTAEIRAIPPGFGLNWLLRHRAADVVHHSWPDERLLADLDTPEDYARYRPTVT